MQADFAFTDAMGETIILVGNFPKEFRGSCTSLECFKAVESEMTPEVRRKINDLQKAYAYWETNQHKIILDDLIKKFPQFPINEIAVAYYVFEHNLDDRSYENIHLDIVVQQDEEHEIFRVPG